MKKIKKASNQNQKLTFDYCLYLKNALGRKNATIKKFEYAISLWLKFTKNKDFKLCANQKIYLDFKEALREGSINGKDISPGSISQILYNLKNFMTWLSQKQGYKSVVKISDIEYLNPSQEEKHYKEWANNVDYPTKEQVEFLCKSIKIENDIDLRDRALIAFMLLSAIRIDALVSLKILSYRQKDKMIDQNPKDKIRVKFSKRITTYLFKFDDTLFKYFDDYYSFLINKGHSKKSALFPKAKINMNGSSFCKSTSLSEEHLSASRVREIIRERCKEANLQYFIPHSFRHAAIAQAFENCSDAQEIKAISQNVGHSSITHVMNIYGQLPEKTLKNCIDNISHNERRNDES